VVRAKKLKAIDLRSFGLDRDVYDASKVQKKIEKIEKAVEKADNKYTSYEKQWKEAKKATSKLSNVVKSLEKKAKKKVGKIKKLVGKNKKEMKKQLTKAKANLVKLKNDEKELYKCKKDAYAEIGELVEKWEKAMKEFHSYAGPFMLRFFKFLDLCKIRRNMKMITGKEAFNVFKNYEAFSKLWEPIEFVKSDGHKVAIGSTFYQKRVKKFFCLINDMNHIVGPVTIFHKI